MKQSVGLHLFAVLLCLLSLCTALAACAPAGTQSGGNVSPVTSTTQAPRTTEPPAQAVMSPKESGMVGTWTAASNDNGILSMTFSEDGSAKLVTQNGQLGGSFIVTAQDRVLLIYGGTTLDASFSVDGETMTIDGGNIHLTLTKNG